MNLRETANRDIHHTQDDAILCTEPQPVEWQHTGPHLL